MQWPVVGALDGGLSRVRPRKMVWLFGTDVVDGQCLLSVQDLETKPGEGRVVDTKGVLESLQEHN